MQLLGIFSETSGNGPSKPPPFVHWPQAAMATSQWESTTTITKQTA